MTEALTQASTDFAGVQDGKETLQQAFTAFQEPLVSYAKAQGFTVSPERKALRRPGSPPGRCGADT